MLCRSYAWFANSHPNSSTWLTSKHFTLSGNGASNFSLPLSRHHLGLATDISAIALANGVMQLLVLSAVHMPPEALPRGRAGFGHRSHPRRNRSACASSLSAPGSSHRDVL